MDPYYKHRVYTWVCIVKCASIIMSQIHWRTHAEICDWVLEDAQFC